MPKRTYRDSAGAVQVTPTGGGGSYAPKTRKGYDLFEVSSAFQKAIRRGDEEVAMYFAVELFNSGFDNYLWKRMRIIVSEDIGLAAYGVASDLDALYNTYEFLKKNAKDDKQAPGRLQVTHAVLMLCRAPKSRLVDWALIAHWREHEKREMDIPDYAFDKHNLRGRRMGRGWEHFFDVGTQLENHTPQEGELEYKRRARNIIEGVTDEDEDDKSEATQLPLL